MERNVIERAFVRMSAVILAVGTQEVKKEPDARCSQMKWYWMLHWVQGTYHTAREVLWKYADSIPNIVNILWQKYYFESIVPYFDSTQGNEAVS